MSTTHRVKIFFEGGRPHVDRSSITVRRDDEIEWESADKERFILNFRDDTPFNTRVQPELIYADAGSTKRKIARKGDEIRGYKYSVIFHGEVLDPIIIVDPH